MGVSPEMAKYLQTFIRATPDPRYDAEIWSEMSIVKRVGRGMAAREPRTPMSEREISDVIQHLVSLSVVPSVTSRGDLRTMLLKGFDDWTPKK